MAVKSFVTKPDNSILRRGKPAMANAKINLSIDVLGVRESDGYHLVRMIMQQIPLYDRLFFFLGEDGRLLPESVEIDENISLACNMRKLPLNEKNLVYKAARQLFDLHKELLEKEKLTIYIEKHIPSGGGLGGGSADGAAVLRAVNNIYTLGLSLNQLEEQAKKLGSDVPFMIRGGAGLAEGTGTDLSKLRPLKRGTLLLVNPNIFLSTEKVYTTLDAAEIPASAHPDTELLIRALETQDLRLFAKNMKNVLEEASFRLCPQIAVLKEEILAAGAIGAMMSGSGSTVFGLFEDPDAAQSAMREFRSRGFFATAMGLSNPYL